MRFVSNIKALKKKKKVLRPTVSEQGKISFLVNFSQEKESDGRDGTKSQLIGWRWLTRGFSNPLECEKMPSGKNLGGVLKFLIFPMRMEMI